MAADLTDYRLGRQLRSASAAATISAPCKPNSVGPDTQVMLTWRTVSPSAWLMVDPRNGARAVIRDTSAHIGRFLWSVLAAGEMDPISDGRTDLLAQAQPSAEAGLRAYAGNQFEAFNGQTGSNVKPR
jgi:hypothetical protein